MKPPPSAHLFILLAAPFIQAQAHSGTLSTTVQYNRDIRPILSENCFFCHGPDAGKRKGKLRLDIREEAIKREAFVPGKPQQSELVRRISATNSDDLMPPPASNKSLNAAQKELLRRWIAGGAQYEGHWAYEKPVRPAIPPKSDPVDWLVQQRLKAIQLSWSPEADRRTLIRRLYFDLLGLPPSPEEVEGFVQDKAHDAYAKLVEKLLASPHYGERMAMGWLDVVRFADTIGYHSDNPRNIWPFRDYVIKAFNDNKPFDVFTREQLAGDLLPQSGLEQKVGSAFNRLLLSTEEGGAQPKDYEARMLTDRVRAVGTVWLGQTIGCAQCHDHKFDPILSRDFYSLGAFFADIREPIVGRREDGILTPNESQSAELAKRDGRIKELENDYDAPHPELRDAFDKWEQEQSRNLQRQRLWTELVPAKAEASSGEKLEIRPDHSVLVSGSVKPDKDTYTLLLTNIPGEVQGLRLEALPDDSLPAHGPGRAENGSFVLSRVIAHMQRTDGSSEALGFTSVRASFEQTIGAEQSSDKMRGLASVIDPEAKGESTGWAVLPEAGKTEQLILDFGKVLPVISGESLQLELQQNHGHGGHTLGHFRIDATADAAAIRSPAVFPPSKELAEILSIPAEKRTPEQTGKMREEFKRTAPEFAHLRSELTTERQARSQFDATLPRCLISISDEHPRTVRILPRGNFLVESGDIVQPAFPAYLKASWQKWDKPHLTRLDLADWLVSEDNPLTARVVMNRLWKQFFGVGLAKPLDDFGAQGESPRNQALLDWLACEFMDRHWDVKHMVRLLVNSRTYKQVSIPSEKARSQDPYNREFSCQGRWRLDAELVRDNALAVSGLLTPKIGGPSVKPYQPEGYWENLNFPIRTWEQSAGEDLYRRGLYTWWQRSYLHPSLLAFDAPTREECCAERIRSNIPQQALVLLNDPTYVEAARVFAGRMLAQGGVAPEARIKWAWRQVLDRPPRTDELAITTALLNKHLTDYRSDPKSAEEVLHIGAAAIPAKVDVPELAAWTSVARVLLNLHETITRN